jgi:asparagine synthase (glutamine-hydrolysing)
MCGIAGIVAARGAPPPNLGQIKRMTQSLAHRGPDGEGVSIEQGVGIGSRRLAVIDPAHGDQPILSEDGCIRVVFNGEIYNFRELRRELLKKGHQFHSDSDGEVIPHLWEEFGTEFPNHLNGMFAIALHDLKQQRLVLVRDRIGIKPLYYTFSGRSLVFASEPKAILASDLVTPGLDVDALGQFLAWEYVPAPRTLFSGILKLEPGSMLDVSVPDLRYTKTVYWDIPQPRGKSTGGSHKKDNGDWDAMLDERIGRAVRRQLVSDVPIGAFLSGGVDSSLIAAHMGNHPAFSVGFAEKGYNELDWSQRVAAHLGIAHQTEVLHSNVSDAFSHLMHFMDDPIGDFSIFPTYLVSRMAREKVKVALSGDGGDELFGGYETYLAQQVSRSWGLIPASLRKQIAEPIMTGIRPRAVKKGLFNKTRRFAEGMQHDPALGHARWRLFLSEQMRSRLFTRDAAAEMKTPVGEHIIGLSEHTSGLTDLQRMQYIDLKSYLSDNCLTKVDRMSMACSIEVRVPLLDHELVEDAFLLPDKYKVRRGKTKVLLKRIAARHVPADCVYRPKEGFSIPVKLWLKTAFREQMEDLLSPKKIAGENLFQPAEVERLKRAHLDGSSDHSHILWSLMVFQDWRERWKT